MSAIITYRKTRTFKAVLVWFEIFLFTVCPVMYCNVMRTRLVLSYNTKNSITKHKTLICRHCVSLLYGAAIIHRDVDTAMSSIFSVNNNKRTKVLRVYCKDAVVTC